MKTGLVLEGGAMRGLFTAGILDVFMAENITFDGTVGVSAGAAFGCNLKSKQYGRILRYNLRFAKDKRFCSVESLLFTGDLYGGKFCYDTLPNHLDRFDTDAFEKDPMEFYVVCTNAETGEPVYYKCTDGLKHDMLYVQGSASMPIVSRPVEADGMKLLDGGISDSIPLKYFESIGYERNILILTQPRSYRKSPQKGLSVMKTALKQYPEIYRDMGRRHEVYNETLEYIREREAQGKVLVLCPDEALGIGRISHDRDALRRVYMTGRETAVRHLDEVRAFLNESRQ